MVWLEKGEFRKILLLCYSYLPDFLHTYEHDSSQPVYFCLNKSAPVKLSFKSIYSIYIVFVKMNAKQITFITPNKRWNESSIVMGIGLYLITE